MSTFAQTLRSHVSVQGPTAGRDAAGQPLPAGWVELRKVYADIRTTGGLEAIRAGAVSAKVNVSIRVRYRDDFDSSMRIEFRGVVYQIVAVLPDGARQHVDLVAEVVS